MSFIPLTAYVDSLPPDFEATEKRLVAEMEAIMRSKTRTEGGGRAIRGAHAESHGIVRARLEILGDLPRAYAQGIFARPRGYDAVVRYSNGVAHIRADRLLGPICGLGLKLFGVRGPATLDEDDDAQTMDLVFFNTPTFFANTAHDYLTIQRLIETLPDAMSTPLLRNHFLQELLTSGGTAEPENWLWDELLSFLSILDLGRQNLYLYTYWSVGAFRHGDYIAKLRVRPTEATAAAVVHREVNTVQDDEPFRDTLVAETGERAHEFVLEAQLCTDLTRMPVENTSVEWPVSESPFVPVARLSIPQQDISAATNLEAADATAINPWRTREKHVPLGEINRVRKDIYTRSAALRRKINHQPVREPAHPSDVLRWRGPSAPPG
ncbi:catalase family protein [Nonomuraea sp. ZG12]|uniref:catalase family protein n=1 Tax=Nonomuraea sp. ZG12 TaxID=3452207 RepID=UPI003F8A01AA